MEHDRHEPFRVTLSFDTKPIAEGFAESRRLQEAFGGESLEATALFIGASLMYADTTDWPHGSELQWIVQDDGRRHPVIVLGFQLTEEERTKAFWVRVAQIEYEKRKGPGLRDSSKGL